MVAHVAEVEARERSERPCGGESSLILRQPHPRSSGGSASPAGVACPAAKLGPAHHRPPPVIWRPTTTIIVNCAGRTRSSSAPACSSAWGTPTVYGLKNGTGGWLLAGESLESGADRRRPARALAAA